MAYICEKPPHGCEHCIHYREDIDGRKSCFAEKDAEKYHNYKSPITLDLEYDHMGKIEKQIIDQSEQYIARAIMKVTNLEVDKDELVKALNYDRAQYEQGYRDGWRERGEKIIRCEECRYFQPMSYDTGRCFCYGLNSEENRILTPIKNKDDYCSDAEEKEVVAWRESE